MILLNKSVREIEFPFDLGFELGIYTYNSMYYCLKFKLHFCSLVLVRIEERNQKKDNNICSTWVIREDSQNYLYILIIPSYPLRV